MINVTNGKPFEISHMNFSNLSAPLDINAEIENIIVEPMFQPLIPNTTVTIDDDGKPVSRQDILDNIFQCCDFIVNADAQDFMHSVLMKTLVYYDNTLPFQEVFATQAGIKSGMPIPSSKVIYTPDDIIDASKEFMADRIDEHTYFANVAFYTRIESFGYYFANEQAWEDFKTWFAGEVSNISQLLSPTTLSLCNDLQNVRLNTLTQSFVLRDDAGQNNEEYSFARVFQFYLTMYEQDKNKNNKPKCLAGCMPFSFSETITPRSIVIMNVEKHAHATAAQIKREWSTIRSSLVNPPKVISLRKLQSLTAVYRQANKLQSMAVNSNGQGLDPQRAARMKFRNTELKPVDLYSMIMKLYKNASNVLTSENATRTVRVTNTRPSRRHPDDINAFGKTKRIIYKPDLHLYIDTSGSISAKNYQDTVKACITLAKKMNVNFYFNSFSHCMSQTVKLNVQNKSVKEIWREFEKVPKVTGGTDYEQIWHYINKSRKFQEELSIVITDFEYYPPNHYVKHPRFLYYAPISKTNWDWIVKSAENFGRNMLNICPNIRKHIMM